MLKRFGLFMLVNLLVLLTVSFTLNLLGVNRYLYSSYGIDYQSLAIFCLVWGMAGSIISLLLSRFMAKKMMGVEVIDPNTRDPELQDLLQMVQALSRSANLPMPEVGIYDSPDVNAFATGPSKSRALVAVSTGLLSRMNRSEIEGVLGHEMTHIANGDMVTMTLIQGVINAFVMFLSRVLAFFISQALRGDDREERGSSSPMIQYLLTFVLEIVFSILGSIVVAWFSRLREFRADAGSAQIAGREKMISALQALKRVYDLPAEPAGTPPAFQALQISSRSGMMNLFASHPALDERIERLRVL
jgi:heat shock protein HtpX